MLWSLLACSEDLLTTTTPGTPEDTESEPEDTEPLPEDTTPTGSTGDTAAPEPTGDTGTGGCQGVEAELVAFFEARDSTGLACTTCAAGPMSFYAVYENPCEVDILLDHRQDCTLTRQLDASSLASGGWGLVIPCSGGLTQINVPAGSRIEEYVYNLELAADQWQIQGTIGAVNLRTIPPVVLTVL